MFDMFDATLDREDEDKLNIERQFYGREALNVIACEGMDLSTPPPRLIPLAMAFFTPNQV